MTTQPVKYDFESTWDGLLAAVKSGGAQAALALIEQEPDAKRRNAWLRFCYQGLVFRDWPEKNLQPMIEAGEEAVAFALRNAETSHDESERFWWTDQANIHCYNLSANLADCWEDGFARDRSHFEKGLELANRADRLREELKKPASSRAMATWAQGKHLLSLHRFDEARAAFNRSLQYEQEVAAAQNQSFELTTGSHFGLVLCHGFIALCGIAAKEQDAAAKFEKVLAVFEQQKSGGEDQKAEAESGIAQLRASRAQLGL